MNLAGHFSLPQVCPAGKSSLPSTTDRQSSAGLNGGLLQHIKRRHVHVYRGVDGLGDILAVFGHHFDVGIGRLADEGRGFLEGVGGCDATGQIRQMRRIAVTVLPIIATYFIGSPSCPVPPVAE